MELTPLRFARMSNTTGSVRLGMLVIGPIIAWKTSTTQRSTNLSFVISFLARWKSVNLEIYVHLPIQRKNSRLTCCTRWNQMQTSTCSTLKRSGVPLTTKARVIRGMSVNMHTIGKTTGESRIFSSMKAKSSASFGQRRKRQRLIRTVVSWSTAVATVMAGKRKSTTRTTSASTSVKRAQVATRFTVPTGILSGKEGLLSRTLGSTQEIGAHRLLKHSCTLITSSRRCLVSQPELTGCKVLGKPRTKRTLASKFMVVGPNQLPFWTQFSFYASKEPFWRLRTGTRSSSQSMDRSSIHRAKCSIKVVVVRI